MAKVHIRDNAPRDEIGYCLLVGMSQPEDLEIAWCKTCVCYLELEGALNAQGIYTRCIECGETIEL